MKVKVKYDEQKKPSSADGVRVTIKKIGLKKGVKSNAIKVGIKPKNNQLQY